MYNSIEETDDETLIPELVRQGCNLGSREKTKPLRRLLRLDNYLRSNNNGSDCFSWISVKTISATTLSIIRLIDYFAGHEPLHVRDD